MATPISTFSPDRAWWKSAVVYQIYPISFFDSNGDGIGDLNGIHAKVDYLKDLGVDVIWLSPIYQSPLADMGYDISDYCKIDPRYGTLEDWDRLLEGVHQRGMKLLMDLVANHTSDDHEWFKQSKSTKDTNLNSKRDWYVWKPPRFDSHGNRNPPNNWRSLFQGSAWEYDEATQEYYLHLFAIQQPDLNWDNPNVREAIWDTMRFWLDRGCDGFRMDVINHISKTDGMPDAPVIDPTTPYQPGSLHYINGPKVHQYIKEMNERVLSHYDIMTVGEAPQSHDPADLAAYVLPENKELDMVFQFELINIDSTGYSDDGAEAESPLLYKPWKLKDLKTIVTKWQQYKREEGFWNAIYIENHDNARSVSRFGNDSSEWRAISAKMLAIFQITQGGTLYVYQGEEIGMANFSKSWGIEEYKDIATINLWKQVLEKKQKTSGGDEVDMSDILDCCQRKARDHARTPMQWDTTTHAGFSSGTPWMRVNEDYIQTWNVSAQVDDPNSVFSFWKRAVQIRKQNDVLIYGDFHLLDLKEEQVFVYTRSLGSEKKALVLLNFGTESVSVAHHAETLNIDGAPLMLNNYAISDTQTSDSDYILRGYEGRVYIQES